MKFKTRIRIAVLAAFSALLLSCDFNQVISDVAEPIDQNLLGTWKAGDDLMVVIARGDKPNHYKLSYKGTDDGLMAKQGAQQQDGDKLKLELTGWVAPYGKLRYFHLQTKNVKQFMLAEIEVKGDAIEFRRINRDFPEPYNPDVSGEVGLINLTTEALRKHIDENREKKHFFWDTVTYRKQG